MDFDEISDAQIAKSVGESLGHVCVIKDDECLIISRPKSRKPLKRRTITTKFDPCNVWNDAGPIIVNGCIELTPLFRGAWCASKIDNYTYDEAPIYGDNQYVDENPLRAAMIVFLMMQENK
jgi:hypothetical protein